MPTKVIRVGVADDHFMVRSGLRRLLSSFDDLHFAGEATSASEAIDLVRLEPLDVLLLDLKMGAVNGLDALPQIRAADPGVAVVILSAEPADRFQEACFRAGARAYLEKPADVERLIAVIRAAARPI